MDGAVRLGVDVGGTFTDAILAAGGELRTAKVPTTEPQSDGVGRAIEAVCEQADVPPEAVEEFRHATTVGTNALLEGTGADVALVTTAGFADVIEIGRQNRPELYDLTARKPDPLVSVEQRYEVAERTTPAGVERPVTETVDPADGLGLDDLAAEIDDETESIAVSLLHAYARPENERAVADRLRESCDARVIASHETLPEIREYERTVTTVVDATITPVIDRYLAALIEDCDRLGVPHPDIMQSNGGIAPASAIRDHAVTTVLSGPAAGVTGASLFGDNDDLVTFDMGGTSADVGLIQNDEVERRTDTSVGGYPVHVPMVDVETVGAGGGSIAWVDEGGALRVGPESAGANPGPACYGRGGTRPTVTDAGLALGYLEAGTELGEELVLDAAPAQAALSTLADRANFADERAMARGILSVASATTARTVRTLTLERGIDPRDLTIVAFGGAGPMVACALADRLDITTIRLPRATGVLSALGVLVADERRDVSRSVTVDLYSATPAKLRDTLESLTDGLDMAGPKAQIRWLADLRYIGQSHELTVEIPRPISVADLEERFHERHEQRRGYRLPDAGIELLTLRVMATVPRDPPEIHHAGSTAEPYDHRDVFFEGSRRETPVYRWQSLGPGTTIQGPAICEAPGSTAVIRPGWTGTVDDRGTITLEVTE